MARKRGVGAPIKNATPTKDTSQGARSADAARRPVPRVNEMAGMCLAR